MDILVYPDLNNSKRIKMALSEFGVDIKDIEDGYFATKGNFFQIRVPSVMIHIITLLEGSEFENSF